MYSPGFIMHGATEKHVLPLPRLPRAAAIVEARNVISARVALN